MNWSTADQTTQGRAPACQHAAECCMRDCANATGNTSASLLTPGFEHFAEYADDELETVNNLTCDSKRDRYSPPATLLHHERFCPKSGGSCGIGELEDQSRPSLARSCTPWAATRHCWVSDDKITERHRKRGAFAGLCACSSKQRRFVPFQALVVFGRAVSCPAHIRNIDIRGGHVLVLLFNFA